MRNFSIKALKEYVVEKLEENFRDYKIMAFTAPKRSGKTTAVNLIKEMLKEKPDTITLHIPFAYSVKNFLFGDYFIKMYKDEKEIKDLESYIFLLAEYIDILKEDLEFSNKDYKAKNPIDIIYYYDEEIDFSNTVVNGYLDAALFFGLETEWKYFDKVRKHYTSMYKKLIFYIDRIKDIAKEIDKELKEKKIVNDKLLQEYNKYVREVLKIISTEILREEVRPDIHIISWLVNLLREIEILIHDTNTNTKEITLIVLVDDMRFVNEYAELLSLFKDRFIPVGIVNRAALDQHDTHQSESEPRLILEKFPIIKIENDISKGIEFLKQELEEKLLKKEEVLV